MKFDRYLTQAMINALNEEYKKEGSWWHKLAEHEDTFIAIRDGYLNVYRNGCSIAKVGYDERSSKLRAEIHYKYLLKKNIDDAYISCDNGSPDFKAHEPFFVSSLSDLKHIFYWTDVLAGLEKTGVHEILKANQNILDVEIALDDCRIDFCALQSEKGQFYIRFFEAKHYSYTQALFAKDELEPAVIEQLHEYQRKLEKYHKDILCAYKNLIRCANRLEGRNILGKLPILSDAALHLDVEPRLVVFGYDADQEFGDKFIKHMNKLAKYLNPAGGARRLLKKGSAKDFREGISRNNGKPLCPSNELSGDAVSEHPKVATL